MNLRFTVTPRTPRLGAGVADISSCAASVLSNHCVSMCMVLVRWYVMKGVNTVRVACV